MNAPRPPELRAALLALATAGCKAFSWNNPAAIFDMLQTAQW